MLPAFLLLGRISLGLMVAGSGPIWLLAGIYQIEPIDYPVKCRFGKTR